MNLTDTPDDELVRQMLGGPNEDDRKYARGMGALAAALSLAGRPSSDIGPSLAYGLNAYSGQLASTASQRKTDLQNALAAKKLIKDELRTKDYGQYFKDDGIDTLGLARQAAMNGDTQTLVQAMSLHANIDKNKKKTPTFIPKGAQYTWDPEKGTAVPIEGIVPGGDEEKPTNNERQIKELMAQGYSRYVAEGVVYGTVKTHTDDSGQVHFYDTRGILGGAGPGGPATVPPSGPATTIATPGTPSAPVGPSSGPAGIPGAGVPPVGPAVAPQVSRFKPRPAPPGTLFTIPSGRQSQALDKAVTDFSAAYEKTNYPRISQVFSELDRELAPYGVKYDPNANEGDGAYVRSPKAKKGDIPGMGATSGFPSIFLSEAGRKIASPIQELINQKLYDLSGKAVTANEMERQMKALLVTPGVRDEDVLRGIGRLRRLYEGSAGRMRKGVNPEILEEYLKRQNFQ